MAFRALLERLRNCCCDQLVPTVWAMCVQLKVHLNVCSCVPAPPPLHTQHSFELHIYETAPALKPN